MRFIFDSPPSAVRRPPPQRTAGTSRSCHHASRISISQSFVVLRVLLFRFCPIDSICCRAAGVCCCRVGVAVRPERSAWRDLHGTRDTTPDDRRLIGARAARAFPACIEAAAAARVGHTPDFNCGDSTGCGYCQRSAGPHGRSAPSVYLSRPTAGTLTVLTHAA